MNGLAPWITLVITLLLFLGIGSIPACRGPDQAPIPAVQLQKIMARCARLDMQLGVETNFNHQVVKAWCSSNAGGQ